MIIKSKECKHFEFSDFSKCMSLIYLNAGDVPSMFSKAKTEVRNLSDFKVWGIYILLFSRED